MKKRTTNKATPATRPLSVKYPKMTPKQRKLLEEKRKKGLEGQAAGKEAPQKPKDRRVIEQYRLVVDNIPADIKIMDDPEEFVPIYELTYPTIERATEAALDAVREGIITEISIKPEEVLDPKEVKELKDAFTKEAEKLIRQHLPRLADQEVKILVGTLLHQSLGLGPLEIFLQDKNLEEIVINSSKSPIWVYHLKIGWLKTNITIANEMSIYNYAAAIGRRVGQQITNLNPLMDAYLTTGDRTNATLFPISSGGNTLTIRKFARRPWTVTDFVAAGTLSSEAAAFLWLAIQYEMNIVIAGGTASGKTSLLNALTNFIPPNQRIISIEDTREIQLPDFLHWVPMTTRPPNPEGRGEITMLQLMINALRMRPDRVVVGEIRRAREAEVMFEAVNTGHSVYSTLHANTAEEAYRRLVNPPINIPNALLSGLQMIAVMHRDRRKNIRRVLQIAELSPTGGLEEIKVELNTIFRWLPSEDKLVEINKSARAMNDIKLYTGMTDEDIEEDLVKKAEIINWMVKNTINDINMVGRIVSEYYRDPHGILAAVRRGDREFILRESLGKK
ncbi:MAG: CpaF family protein [Candidatus Aenigmarchaeota archaeon]|nr:CpaF family protein [Candidatus Aenigmarchaeota archaeon]